MRGPPGWGMGWRMRPGLSAGRPGLAGGRGRGAQRPGVALLGKGAPVIAPRPMRVNREVPWFLAAPYAGGEYLVEGPVTGEPPVLSVRPVTDAERFRNESAAPAGWR